MDIDRTDDPETRSGSVFEFIDSDEDTDDNTFDMAASAAAVEQLTEANAEAQSIKKRSRKRSRDGDNIRASKVYKQIQLSEVDLEEEVADACGLHPRGLIDHEHAILTDDMDEEVYFRVS